MLGEALEAVPGDIPSALARYQLLRRERAVRVVDAASRNAWKYHLRAPLNWPAHQLLKLGGYLAPQRVVSQFDWIYRHDVTQQN